MRLLPTLPILFAVLAALSVAACKNMVIRPPTDAAGFYANPIGRDEP